MNKVQYPIGGKENMNYEDFHKQYSVYVDAIENCDNLPENYNIFRVLALDSMEVRHSNFLKWLLQYQDKNKERPFLKRWLNALDIPVDETELKEDVKIHREEYIPELDEQGRAVRCCAKKNVVYFQGADANSDVLYSLKKTKDGKVKKTDSDRPSDKDRFKDGHRYIDINIIGKSFTLTVENKVDSGEHSFQCIAYRNYMQNDSRYREKKHYYYLLAKEKPVPFDNSADGVYPGYRFTDYSTIQTILNEMLDDETIFDENAISTQIVRQYVALLDEWRKLPQRYVDITKQAEEKNGHNMPDFQDGKFEQFKELLSDKDVPEKDKRFIGIARQYYLEIKNQYDEEIEKILKKICKYPNSVDADRYGRGNYANALFMDQMPLREDQEKDYSVPESLSEQIHYLEKYDVPNTKQALQNYYKNKLTDKNRQNILKNIKDREAKQAKQNAIDPKMMPFKSIDFRAPREGQEHMSILITCGLLGKLHQSLCNELVQDSFVCALDRANGRNWEAKLNLVVRNGSAQGAAAEVHRILCSIKGLSELKKEEREACFQNDLKKYIGKKSKKAVHEDNFKNMLQFLVDRKLFNQSSLNDLNSRMERYLADNKSVNLNWQLELISEVEDKKITPLDLYQRILEGVEIFGPKYHDLFKKHVFVDEEQINNL